MYSLLHHYGMGNIAITTTGEQTAIVILIKVSSYRVNIRHLINNYLSRTINQCISTRAKRITGTF